MIKDQNICIYRKKFNEQFVFRKDTKIFGFFFGVSSNLFIFFRKYRYLLIYNIFLKIKIFVVIDVTISILHVRNK